MLDKTKPNLISRPPVVVFLGHVDHGKSSILEAIKDLKITAKESGGITQHIGAYEIEENGKNITFIDTPGHEAFSQMRMRGARVADIAVLVVAADEGIKPQTKEAIAHIKAAGIPMIVALNKMDNPNADPEKVKRELISEDVLVESMGGKVLSVEVSAKTKKGISQLLEAIVLVSEMEDLKADVSVPAQGIVIESYLDSFKGPVATVIVESGILKKGDLIGTDTAFGKVKGIENFLKKPMPKAGPSVPAIIIGFEKVPGVGEEFKVYESLERYKKEPKKPLKIDLADFQPKEEEGKKIVSIVVKSDVFGSLEAILEVLKLLPQEKAGLKILKAEVGEVNDSDVKLAKTSNAKIICFKVKANLGAEKLAMREKISIIKFDIIYELAQAVRNLLEKSIAPDIIRTDLGKIKVLAVFKTEKSRQIIGGKVLDGIARRGAFAEVIRDNEIIGKGKIVGLQKDKKEVPEADKRSECGMLFEGNAKIEEKDILVVYSEEKQKAYL